mmetsp:Transcript_63377/g.137969  ORF Transcript_63377/g.137969 Transcript_63377/m.137969 type:complete len:131 (-) Transcript_63377:234-626(-)
MISRARISGLCCLSALIGIQLIVGASWWSSESFVTPADPSVLPSAAVKSTEAVGVLAASSALRGSRDEGRVAMQFFGGDPPRTAPPKPKPSLFEMVITSFTPFVFQFGIFFVLIALAGTCWFFVNNGDST